MLYFFIQDFPYIYTNINSVPGWQSEDEDNDDKDPVTPSDPPQCPPSATFEEAPVWVIAIICVLAAALLLETMTLLAIIKSKNNKERSSMN